VRRWVALSEETLRLYQQLWRNDGELSAEEEQRFVYESGLSAPDISITMLKEI